VALRVLLTRLKPCPFEAMCAEGYGLLRCEG